MMPTGTLFMDYGSDDSDCNEINCHHWDLLCPEYHDPDDVTQPPDSLTHGDTPGHPPHEGPRPTQVPASRTYMAGPHGSLHPGRPPDWVRLYDVVRSSGAPNFRGAKIPVTHQLNIPQWRYYADRFKDPDLPDLLAYGFPLNYTSPQFPHQVAGNHTSATYHPEHVDTYIATELAYGALQGPFSHPPFHPAFHTSPLMTSPKKNSHQRRVILDLSFPHGTSVNTGIPRDTYLGTPYKLHLPSAQDLRDLILTQGAGCHLWSLDLKRGYRQLRVCPLDWPLLGIQWKGQYYFDTAVPFGIRWGAMYMHRTTSALTSIAAYDGIPTVAYIDDIAGAQSPARAQQDKAHCQHLMEELGLEEQVEKGTDPDTRMVWLGVHFDTQTMVMSVPHSKIEECLSLAGEWAHKTHCTRSQLRRFLGKLFHIAQCCPTLRLFVNRLLETLRVTPEHGYTPIPPTFYADIRWILQFLPVYNGIQMIPYNPTLPTPIVVDSCLTGCGGHFGSQIYYSEFPAFILEQHLTICQLEMLNVLVAIRLWSDELHGHVVRVRCDNASAVSVLQHGRGRDPFLLACARDVWHLTARFNFEIRIEHVPGHENHLADQLSRYYVDKSCRAQIEDYIAHNDTTLHTIPPEWFMVSNIKWGP